MLGYFLNNLFTCCRKPLPQFIDIRQGRYQFMHTMKHDSFACTSLYKLTEKFTPLAPDKITLKISRQQNFFGLPGEWLGQIICEHELKILKKLQNTRRVPQIICRFGRTGFIYKYIEGSSLDEDKNVPDDFFDNLMSLLQKIHRHNIAYIDMNKKGNIIRSKDNLPWLVDFQISLFVDKYFLISKSLTDKFRNLLFAADIYHLLKHKRKIRPDLLRPEEIPLSHCSSKPMKLHRAITKPLRKARRKLMTALYSRELLKHDCEIQFTPENDPSRFVKRS